MKTSERSFPHRLQATVRSSVLLVVIAFSAAVASAVVLGDGSRRAARAASSLSVAQLAGERVIYSYAGLQPPASLIAAVRAGEAAGVILFGSNIASRPQLARVLSQLQRAALSSPVHARLLVMTDQEGGEVRRLPGAPLLSERQIGQSLGGLVLARLAGAGAARSLASVGVNVNLAPVLDVYRRPGNFIDRFQRSYSSNPVAVGRLGTAFITAQQASGVAATAKHFPGLGAASATQNTDARPVTLNVTLATLRSVDEAPYRATIPAGVRLVMTSWAVYPALDPSRPAGISPRIVTGELRGRLGFGGVTLTDAIGAGAISGYGSVGRRSVLAAGAGEDLILAAPTDPSANSPSMGLAAFRAIEAAIASHQLGLSAARGAAARVLALRARP
jgi:beta-N-acetylhexosaminidase